MSVKNIALTLDQAIYQAAQARAQQEGRALETVLAEMIATYTENSNVQTHTVQAGDSLARIARQYYGDPYQYPTIQRANQLETPQIWVGQVLIIPAIETPEPTPTPQPEPEPTPEPEPAPEPQVDPCAPIPGESYIAVPIEGGPADRPAHIHADINLELRGYTPTTSTAGLIDMGGPTDPRAPQLATLFGDTRTPEFGQVYQAHAWNWGPPPNEPGTRGPTITDFDVTVAGFIVEPGEIIHVPDADYEIYGPDKQVLVLYATKERITLKYTREDTIATGYAIHVDNICVEPSLLALYEKCNREGRRELPALRARQPFGRAKGEEIQVAIRDTGRFMDPRVRKDWWRGR